MYFNCQISVQIGDKKLETVHAVESRNDSSHIGAECTIEVPVNCRIQYQNGNHDFLTDYPKNLFKVGDAVLIQAMYEGYNWITVFKGFVSDFVEGTPTLIKCADFIYQLNQTVVDKNWKSISIKDLVIEILQGTGVTLILPTIDLQLENITFRLMSPAAVLEWLKKELGINISLSGDQLYMNIASNTVNSVKFRTDQNVIECSLQKPDAIFQNFRVKAWFIREDGTKDSYEVGNTTGQLHEVYFYKVKRDMSIYKKMAEEALNKIKQEKYHGRIETLLYPDCNIFDKAVFVDVRYPERSANYVITGMDFKIGDRGYHRILKLSYLSELS